MSTPSAAGTAGSAPDEAHRLRVEEFAALRATIRERGSRRIALMMATIVAWATLAVAVDVLVATPVSTLIPLLVLAAGFEAAFALHVGVERIGRYLQVEYEGQPGAPAWEHTAMRFGAAPVPAPGRVDPLFAPLFIAATVLNMVPVLLTTMGIPGGRLELAVFGIFHAALIVRVVRARAYAARQRGIDLAILTPPTAPPTP